MKTRSDHLSVRLAETDRDLLAAQRLRYKVFVEELGGQGTGVDHQERLERDAFDPYCEHLLLVDERRNTDTLEDVVGVYRLLDEEGAKRAGRYYTDAEYDLAPLKNSGRKLLELGRSCLHADHRGGTGMLQLWQGLGQFVEAQGIEVLFGVASFHGTNAAALAEPLSLLHHRYLAPDEMRVRSRNYQQMNLMSEDQIDRVSALRATPALIKAYLRLGGYVGDGAYVDHDFNTTDVCLVMDTVRMSASHRAIYTKAVG